jgi:UTP-glucose-1-phosphate uridylyltransferase
VYTGKGEAVGYGHAVMTAEEMVAEPQGIAVELSRVFMREDTYPRAWKMGPGRNP